MEWGSSRRWRRESRSISGEPVFPHHCVNDERDSEKEKGDYGDASAPLCSGPSDPVPDRVEPRPDCCVVWVRCTVLLLLL